MKCNINFKNTFNTFFVISIIFCFFPHKVFAGYTEPRTCPVGLVSGLYEDRSVGFHLDEEGIDHFCCENGSSDLGNPGNICLNTVNHTPAWGTQNRTAKNRMFCPDNTYRWDGKCYTARSSISRSLGIFLGCKEYETNVPFHTVIYQDVAGIEIPYPITEYGVLGFCAERHKAFWLETGSSCSCNDDIELPVDIEGTTCFDACSDKGGEFYSLELASGGLLSNDPVSCQTAHGEGVITAIGCIPVESTGLANWAILFGTIIGGVIAVLKIIQGSFMIMTATGNPDKLQEGRSVITSALVGLVVILSAVLMLNFFGFDVLGLGRFGFNLD